VVAAVRMRRPLICLNVGDLAALHNDAGEKTLHSGGSQ
jgi:hypothetical protein